MSNRPKYEEVISYNGIDYHEGDLVEIQTIGTYGHNFIGCIDSIDTSSFWLDVSEKYNAYIKKFDYDEIESIKYFDCKENSQCE